MAWACSTIDTKQTLLTTQGMVLKWMIKCWGSNTIASILQTTFSNAFAVRKHMYLDSHFTKAFKYFTQVSMGPIDKMSPLVQIMASNDQKKNIMSWTYDDPVHLHVCVLTVPKVLNRDLGIVNSKHGNEICNKMQLGKSLLVSMIRSWITSHLRAIRCAWSFKSLQIINS